MKPTPLKSADTQKLLNRQVQFSAEVDQTVENIFLDIANDGDAAVRRFSKKLDDVSLGDFYVSKEVWGLGVSQVPQAVRTAIDNNLQRIFQFHVAQMQPDFQVETAPGLILGQKKVPYQRVACYVPGGLASYPSTVLMTVTLARIAGVREIIVATPPRPDGSVDNAVLYAAKLAGATKILRVGGAHAVAALSLGTESIPKVQAIVGPGNQYVTAAKARALCHTDAPAGPSELLVIADETADPKRITWDLLAQAEHDPAAQVVLVTTSAALADAVAAEIALEAPLAARAPIIQSALENGAILVADTIEEAIQFSNDYAPEHLEIMTIDPAEVLDKITAAGSVFLGDHTPVSLGDYGSGTNHVLPTMGQAAIRGGLSLEDFRTTISWQQATPEGLRAVADDIATLAQEEGLQMHAEAVRRRL